MLLRREGTYRGSADGLLVEIRLEFVASPHGDTERRLIVSGERRLEHAGIVRSANCARRRSRSESVGGFSVGIRSPGLDPIS
jgi:hypothetical protein